MYKIFHISGSYCSEEVILNFFIKLPIDAVFPSTWVVSRTNKNYEQHVVSAESPEYKQVVKNMTDGDGELYVDRICKVIYWISFDLFFHRKIIIENYPRDGMIIQAQVEVGMR
jgi:hypothetical protein